jgi:parvulin-like peptidyl-prolyl isomerase
MTLEPGTWSGPLPSTYGWHLVRVEAKEATALAPLDDVRNAMGCISAFWCLQRLSDLLRAPLAS